MKKRFCRLTALFLAFLTCAFCCLFTACGDGGYDQKKSTEEELTTVLKMGTHDVPYELFRALFINRKAEVDGGDPSLWTGADAAQYHEKIMPLVLEDLAAIYATFDLAKEYDIDPFGDDVSEELSDQITISVEGGTWNGVTIQGFDNYDAYLDSLAKNGMNDGASRLLLRYQICEDRLIDLLAVPYTSKYTYTEADVQALYESDDCRRFVLLYRETNALGMTKEEHENVVLKGLEKLRAETDGTEIVKISKQYFQNSITEIENGSFLTPNALGRQVWGEVLDEAFALEVSEFSEPIAVSTATQDFLYVVHRIEKDTDAYKKNAEDIEELYVRDRLYNDLKKKEKSLLTSVVYTEFYNTLIGKNIIYP